MKRVIILHGYTTEYRIPFFKELNKILQENNISLKVVVGKPSKYEKYDSIEHCDFFSYVKNRYLYYNNKYLVWEPVLSLIMGNDLVIMRQAKKHLSNPFVTIYCILTKKKIALWGNMKAYIYNKPNLNFKRIDHWFAYNTLTKKIVESTGFPSEKITSLNNSIDTKFEQTIYNSITDEEVCTLKLNHGIEKEDLVGLFCSRLYSDKRIEFLLQSVAKVKEGIPNFKFFVIGDGIEKSKIMEFSDNNQPWFIVLGPKYSKEKIAYFRISDFQLLPGAVGLHIVDSFALETPINTTNNKTHGVEIDYLKNFENGIMTENTLESYTNAIIKVCTDNDLRKNLQRGCLESAKVYTVEDMAYRFASGILKTLEA